MEEKQDDLRDIQVPVQTDQIDLLAQYMMEKIPSEPSQDEGAGDCAIRLLTKYRLALRAIMLELVVSGPGYPVPVDNAYEIAREALDISKSVARRLHVQQKGEGYSP